MSSSSQTSHALLKLYPFFVMATMTISRPLLHQRHSSFEHAIQIMPPFMLGPRPGIKRSDSFDKMVQSIEPVMGKALSEGLISYLRLITKKTQKFSKEVQWGIVCWILHPNALLMLLFWPGWLLVALAWIYWVWA